MQDEINAFEAGQLHWNGMSRPAKNWYMENFHPSDITIGMDANGPMTLQDKFDTIRPPSPPPQPQNYNDGDVVLQGQSGASTPLPSFNFSGVEGINAPLAQGLNAAGNFYSNPANLPAWYGTQYNAETGTYERTKDAQGNNLSPIANFTEDQVAAQQGFRDAAANQQSALETQQDYYGNIARGDDAYGQELATRAAAQTSQPFATSGTIGGARHAYAANQAAGDILQSRQANAVNSLGNLNYTQPAATLAGVGQQNQDFNQNLKNQDVAAWNYFQQLPQQQIQNYLSTAQLGAAAEKDQNIAPQAAQKQSGLEKILGYINPIASIGSTIGLWNDGGMVNGMNMGGMPNNMNMGGMPPQRPMMYPTRQGTMGILPEMQPRMKRRM